MDNSNLATPQSDFSEWQVRESEELHEKALGILNRNYGYSSFRPGQWEVIESVLNGRDAVVLMPTGGGKSVCFQMAALMSEGCCLVVTPLISLMKDQVQALRANGIEAEAINSFNTESKNRDIYRRAASGELKLLYLSPERLLMDITEIQKMVRVSLVAVDEAHCISQWGHDFRPVYTSLKCIKEQWPNVPVMALTATADRLTREDIASALSLSDPYVHIGSFDRPNLSLQVVQGAPLAERVRIISDLIYQNPDDCGIVYCLSRKKSEAMAERLSDCGFRVGCYHAGMSALEREVVQREFVEGKYQAICATVAFGMGIDKSNIRWVVHNNIPGNIESYYQEIGRAGRDGMPATTILFYSYSDIITRMKFVDESGQREINESKLRFMQRYAEASVCRRRILLSYFSEEFASDCGNCDNCRNPRPRFDGTVMAQKALSAIVRTRSQESIGHIIEILRGNRNQHILSHGYDRLPTFGVGADTPSQEWHAYILQMIQLGLIEVAYEENLHLRPTPLGMKVLRGQARIELAQYVRDIHQYADQPRRTRPADTAPALTGDELLTANLKELRRKLAEKNGIADYMVFSDATIADIVTKKPTDLSALARVEGMSMARIAAYSRDILSAIKKSLRLQEMSLVGLSGAISRLMYESGMRIEEIATMRSLQENTILSHLLGYIDDGLSIDLDSILSPEKFMAAMRMIEVYESGRDMTDIAGEANRNLMAGLRESHGLSEREVSLARLIARYMTAEDGRYVRLEQSLAEPSPEYGAEADETDPDELPFDPEDPDDGLE